MQTVDLLTARLLGEASRRLDRALPLQQPDWGVPLLARLYAAAAPDDPARAGLARRSVLDWAGAHARGSGRTGLFVGGLAGTVVGLAHASVVEPRLRRLATLAADRLTGWATTATHRTDGVAYADYDLLTGPAGVILALPAGAGALRPLVDHLCRLSDVDDLRRLRAGDTGTTAPWTVGRINLGLGHGVPGVLAALVAAARDPGSPRPDLDADPPARGSERPGPRRTRVNDKLMDSIGRLARFVVRCGRLDGDRVVRWPFATPAIDRSDPAAPSVAIERRRQGWCYGTPGIAWQLVEAGTVLGDRALRDFGVAAMESLCAAWDDSALDRGRATDRLGFCHGAAGVLAVADAFALHAGLDPARRLADHLHGLILAELDGLVSLAETDRSLPSGAVGVLAVLLSREPPHRDWLRVVALR